MTPIVMSWSGGKDSCVALRDLRLGNEFEVVALLTTITSEYDRISMHGGRRVLLQDQADALGLPLCEVSIPSGCSNQDYEAAMGAALSRFRDSGVDTVAFGDLFLEDIRTYRDAMIASNSMRAVYPVWGRDTRSFIEEFIDEGFEAVTCCVDLEVLPADFAGRLIDRQFVADLPHSVDPCGENGEFHTFVFNGPGFRQPVPLIVGETLIRDRFGFCDLIPEPAPSEASISGIAS